MEFKNRIALITGGSGGIGRAISARLVEAGAGVILVARDPEKGKAAESFLLGLGGRARFFSVELGDPAAVQDLVRTVEREWGALHLLVNNAGGGDYRLPSGPLEMLSAAWNRQLADNFASAYWVSSLAVELMKRSPKTERGAIVNISSTASLHGTYGLYSAMKAGLEGLTRAMACEYAPLGIRANAVAPGWIRTAPPPYDGHPAVQAWERSASLLGRQGLPDEVASAVLFLASSAASFITGATLFVDGGLSINDPTNEGFLNAAEQARRDSELSSRSVP